MTSLIVASTYLMFGWCAKCIRNSRIDANVLMSFLNNLSRWRGRLEITVSPYEMVRYKCHPLLMCARRIYPQLPRVFLPIHYMRMAYTTTVERCSRTRCFITARLSFSYENGNVSGDVFNEKLEEQSRVLYWWGTILFFLTMRKVLGLVFDWR